MLIDAVDKYTIWASLALSMPLGQMSVTFRYLLLQLALAASHQCPEASEAQSPEFSMEISFWINRAAELF